MEQSNEYPSYYREPEVVKESIYKGSEALQKAPEITGVPTGIEGLDDLFFTVKEKNGKLRSQTTESRRLVRAGGVKS